jgi:hypothetical protein
MRIRIVTRPSSRSIDDIRLDRFELGRVYEVGTATACLMLAEGWAAPVEDEEPARLAPLPKTDPAKLPNLIIDKRPHTDRRRAVAAHRFRRP